MLQVLQNDGENGDPMMKLEGHESLECETWLHIHFMICENYVACNLIFAPIGNLHTIVYLLGWCIFYDVMVA